MEGRRLLAAEGVWRKEESSYLHHAAALEDRRNRHEEERKREQARWSDEREALLKRCARLESLSMCGARVSDGALLALAAKCAALHTLRVDRNPIKQLPTLRSHPFVV